MRGASNVEPLSFERDGACLWPGAAAGDLGRLHALAAAFEADQAGTRLEGGAILRGLADPGGSIHAVAAANLGPEARAVRAVLFDKSDRTNWGLGWHQDRVIAVKARHNVPGFGPWTVKAGIPHVAPPFALLEAMVTLRVHLDDVPGDNAPLQIAPGSHRFGRIAEADIPAIVARCGKHACLAARGDIWAYATPILHASDRAGPGRRRRVLQIDFAAQTLPAPLAWREL